MAIRREKYEEYIALNGAYSMKIFSNGEVFVKIDFEALKTARRLETTEVWQGRGLDEVEAAFHDMAQAIHDTFQEKING